MNIRSTEQLARKVGVPYDLVEEGDEAALYFADGEQ